jgi:hypothetical protein
MLDNGDETDRIGCLESERTIVSDATGMACKVVMYVRGVARECGEC